MGSTRYVVYAESAAQAAEFEEYMDENDLSQSAFFREAAEEYYDL